ncbi:MAG: serine/threonine-protein kinase [Bacteroidota bacterium]
MTPTPERWARLTNLLGDALERAGAERAAYLREACADDPTLVAEVERLLTAHQAAESSQRFASGVFDLAPAALAEAAPLPDIGPYRLVREIGRGGMGTVWLAERADGLFEQRVAVKLMRAGVVSEDQHRRFGAERRILARLDHPHIARLLDGGMTAPMPGVGVGQPYLVMEYVEGVPITTYCRERALPLADRLALFRTVCETVAYAHQNLVVHRDLKPSNIFVANDADGTPGPDKPTVKLLDFGIAKLLTDEETLDASTPVTRTGQALMTPEYAAPEQVRGEAITTATDVYALGVVLYELLVGHRPYAIEDRSATAVERAVLEAEPTKPSTALRAASPPALAADPTRLARRLRGDLDTIVLKALRKEPERRYRSAADLADDLRRHAEGLPVTARPDTPGYRVRKFATRHRAGVAASVALAAALLLGLGGTLWQAQLAQTEAAKATAVNDFLVGMLAAADPTEEGRDVRVAALLDRAAADLDSSFADQPLVEADLRATLGVVYTELGLYDEATTLLERALALLRQAHGPQHPQAIETQSRLGRLAVLQGAYAYADSLLTDALQATRHAPGDAARANLYSNLGYARYVLGDYAGSEEAHREAVRLLEAQTPREEIEIASALGNVAIVLSDLGQLEEATPILERQVEIYRTHLGPDNSRLARALANLGSVYYDRALGPEAVAVLTEAVDISTRVLGADNTERGWALGNLGSAFTLVGRAEEAETAFRESLGIYQATLGEDHPRTAGAHLRLGRLIYLEGRLAEGMPHAERATAIWQAALPDDHPAIALGLMTMGEMHADRGAAVAAEAALREAYRIRRVALPEDHPDTAESASVLGALLAQHGTPAEAEDLLRAGYASLRRAAGPDDSRTQQAANHLRAFCDAHDCTAASRAALEG